MYFLTYEDLTMLGIDDITESEFDENITEATDAIHDLTNHIYHFKNFDNEPEYLKTMFKKAIAAQIKLYTESGVNTAYGMKQPQSVNMGRTSITMGGGGSESGGLSSIYADEAIGYLRPTGLLYRGL